MDFSLLMEPETPWTTYRTLVDLYGYPEDDPRVLLARQEMLEHPLVKGLMQDLSVWPTSVLSSHKSAAQPFHKLSFLAEIGVTKEDVDMADILRQVFLHRSEEGLPLFSCTFQGHQDVWAWALCDAPLLLYCLVKMKAVDASCDQKPIRHLLSLARSNGWPCVVSLEPWHWRGPGKKDDPCPYATLLMLKLLAQCRDRNELPQTIAGTECLLNLWENSRSLHPYMFYMGTDFRKLKAPFIWYDILHVADVLSYYPYVYDDPRFCDMLEVIASKRDANGMVVPESIWKAWEEWDFGQKKIASSWLTFLVVRLLKRMGRL